MTEELRQELTVLYMLRGMEEMQQEKMLQTNGVQAPPPQMPQPPRTSGTMPGVALQDALPPSTIAVKTPNGIIGIPVENIVCCEAAGKNTLVRCMAVPQPHSVFHSLTDIEERIDAQESFVRIHRSKLLNLAYCKGWKNDGKEALAIIALGSNEEQYSVSRTCKAEFVRAWKKYIVKNRPKF
jgi:DNA-binding LytR/AlgR family response regulator